MRHKNPKCENVFNKEKSTGRNTWTTRVSNSKSELANVESHVSQPKVSILLEIIDKKYQIPGTKLRKNTALCRCLVKSFL